MDSNKNKKVIFTFDKRSLITLQEMAEEGNFSSMATTVSESLLISQILQTQIKKGYTEVIVRDPKTEEAQLVIVPWLQAISKNKMDKKFLKKLRLRFETPILPLDVLKAAIEELLPRDYFILQKRLEGHTFEELGVLIDRGRELARRRVIKAMEQISDSIGRDIRTGILIKIGERLGRSITQEELRHVKGILSPVDLQIFEARLKRTSYEKIGKSLNFSACWIQHLEVKLLYQIECTLLSQKERIQLRPKSIIPESARKIIDMDLSAFAIANITSIRVQNKFRNNLPDKTVKDLAQMTEEDLMSCCKISKIHLGLVRAGLIKFDLHLGMNFYA